MRADTGVGPAMASGSQVWRKNCPDLDMTAAVRHSAAARVTVWLMVPLMAASFTPITSKVPAPKNRMDTPIDDAHVAHPVGEEGLEGGVGVVLLLPPVADEHERAHSDQLPAHQHLKAWWKP